MRRGSSATGLGTLGRSDGTSRPVWRWLLVILAVFSLWLCLASVPALAKTIHPFVSSFNGSPAVSFAEPVGVAVEGVSGDVYVADKGNKAVYKFDSTGTNFLSTLTGPPGGFGEVRGVAVSSFSGEVYVVDSENKAVYEFDSTGTLIATLTGPPGGFGEPLAVAVDGSGDVYVADRTNKAVYEFDSTGTLIATLTGPPGGFDSPRAVAVDASGDVYVADNEEHREAVYEFGPTGVLLSTISGPPSGSFINPDAVALDGSGDVYVSDNKAEPEAVYEFDSTDTLVSTVTGPPGGFGNALGVAVDPISGELYVADKGAAAVDIFGPAVVVPDVVTGSVENPRLTSITLTGTANPDGVPLTDCQFEYVDEADYEPATPDPYSAGPPPVPCSQSLTAIGSGSSTVRVSAEAHGLQSHTFYHFRLAAANANGASQGRDATFTFIAPTKPSIDAATAQNITPTSSELTAKINPNNGDTTYHFEYGTSTEYGTSIPVPDGEIAASLTDQTVTQQVTGLEPNTTYHFRVVAQNVAGTITGPDHTFVYDTAPGGLPDGRAYEMVTPVEKAGAVVSGGEIAADGSSLIGFSEAAFAGLTDGELASSAPAIYRFTRTGDGWKTTPLTCCGLEGVSLDNNGPIWHPAQIDTGVDHLFLSNKDGSIGDIGPVWPPALGREPGNANYSVEGGASEASHGVVFAITNQSLLWPFDTTINVEGHRPSLYEYVGTCGGEVECERREPALVGVQGSAGSKTLESECGISLGASRQVASGSNKYNAVSESGQTVFFTAEAGDEFSPPYTTSTCSDGVKTGTAPPTNELYGRLDGSQTVWVSEPQCTRSIPACENVSTDKYETEAESKAANAIFEGASADGSKVFFTTTQQLTSSDTDATRDLYEYDFSEPAGHRLIQVSGGGSGDATLGRGAEVEGVSRISEDGSHVYFVAKGVLTTTSSPGAQGYGEHGEPVEAGAVAQPHADNLYVYDTETGTTAFIAELCSGPEASGSAADARCPSSLNSEPWTQEAAGGNDQRLWSHGEQGGDDERPVSATPDGSFLVFTSYGDLTADDTSTARQVFQYDAQTERLVRVSVGQDGFNNNGNTRAGAATTQNPDTSNARIVSPSYIDGRSGKAERTMSGDGSYVFFQSPVGLTSQALNEIPIDSSGDLAQNVYEYHDGNVSLISDGMDTSVIGGLTNFPTGSGVFLIGTDESAADVFFTSVDPLVPQDTDTTQEEIYDARIGGGFPPPSTPPECQGEPCQGAQSAPPLSGVPSSATFSGAGNLAPPPPAKPKAKPLTRAQKLAKARNACREKRNRKKRAACEKQAKRAYGATSKPSKSANRKRSK
jgi:streptogramin lyase